MNACIDVGNTRIKLALFKKRKLKEHFIFGEHDYKAFAKAILNKKIKHVILSSTKKEQAEIRLILKQFDSVTYLDYKTKLPIDSIYKTPKTLGKDRIAAAVGAYHLYPNNGSIIVDAGTCITMDFINKKGIYQGGNICPGIHMRIESMHNYTDKLPLVPIELPKDILGNTTKTSLQNGAIRGVLFEIENFSERIKQQEKEINIILTGGDANFLAEYLKTTIFVHDTLVPIGLNEILLYNV